jgi:hypothetical protein
MNRVFIYDYEPIQEQHEQIELEIENEVLVNPYQRLLEER